MVQLDPLDGFNGPASRCLCVSSLLHVKCAAQQLWHRVKLAHFHRKHLILISSFDAAGVVLGKKELEVVVVQGDNKLHHQYIVT